MKYFDKVILKIYGQNTCKSCDKEIDIDCLSFDTSPTDAGTEHFAAEIKCSCGEEIKSISDYEHVSTVTDIMEHFELDCPIVNREKVNFDKSIHIQPKNVIGGCCSGVSWHISNDTEYTIKINIEVKEV